MPIVTAVVVSFALVTAVVVSEAFVTIVVVRYVGGVAEHLLCDVVGQHKCVSRFAVAWLVDRGAQSPTVAVVAVLQQIGGQAKAALSGASLAVTPSNVLLSRSYCALSGNTKSWVSSW